MDDIATLVQLMMDTDFPCWKPGTIDNLRARFCAGRSVREAAAAMNQEILNSFKGLGYFSSYLYDVFQSYTQGIHY
jgi:phosphatidylinositol 4-kinase